MQTVVGPDDFPSDEETEVAKQLTFKVVTSFYLNHPMSVRLLDMKVMSSTTKIKLINSFNYFINTIFDPD